MDKFTTVPNFNRAVSVETYREDIEALAIQIRPEWSGKKIKIEGMDGGIINRMYECWEESSSDDKLVVRVYLEHSKDFEDEKMKEAFDRSREIRNLEKIRNLEIGPELIAVYSNGLCYKYLKGITLDCDSIQTPEMIPRVTKILATLNAQPPVDWRTAWSADNMLEFIVPFPPDLKDPERTKRLLALIPDQDAMVAEFARIKNLIPADAEYVYCHGDTKGENFIWDSLNDDLRLIDFEHGGMHLQPFEIASHFVSFTDVRNPQRHRFPDKDFQTKWIESYLRYYYRARGDNQHRVTDVQVERLRVDVNIMAQFCRLFLGIGCLNLVTNNVFDAFDFCVLHLTEYFEYRSAVEASVKP